MTAAQPAPDPDLPAPPTLSQLERARLDNRDQWRTSGIIMLVLLITGIGIMFRPVVAIYTLLATRRNERDALAGVYGRLPTPRIDEKALNWWLGAAGLVGCGMWLVVAGTWPLMLVGVLMVAAGVALRPWTWSLRAGS